MAKTGRSPLFSRLVAQVPAETYERCGTVGDVFEAALAILRKGTNRDEYVYRSALTLNILLGRHSLRTASMLNEFRVGNAKADVAILNGTTTVYEIKSERDSTARLVKQIEAYNRVFARTYVVAGSNYVEAVKSLVEPEVGILRLTSRGCISEVRVGQDCPTRICPLAVLDCVRTSEAVSILNYLNVSVPDVPNTQVRGELQKRFSRLKSTDVHAGFVATLKRTRAQLPLATLVEQVPPSLRAAALSVPLKKSEHGRLIGAVNTQLREAMLWR
jgi:hypothetical protein